MHFSRYALITCQRKKYMLISLILISILVSFTGILKQENWPRTFVSILTFSENSNSHNNNLSEKEPDVHIQSLVTDGLWFVPSFSKNTEKKTNNNQMKSKRRICILNVDTRPLERFSNVNKVTKMELHSIAAYSNLYYGKPNCIFA